MFKDERLVALEEMTAALGHAVEQYQHLADLTESPELAKLFSRLAATRRGLAAELEHHMRERGELPKDPDADLETVEKIWDWLRAQVLDEQSAMVLHKAADLEKNLSETAANAEPFSHPPVIRRLLERLQAHTRQALAEIDKHLPA